MNRGLMAKEELVSLSFCYVFNRVANATVRVERLSWTDELNCPVAS